MNVLLAVDSSSASTTIIEETVARPWPRGTVFCVLSVVDEGRWEGLPALIEDAKQQAKSVLQKSVHKLRLAGLEVFSEMPVGSPKKIIPEFASKQRTDLILLGSKGHRAVSRFLLGSVAQAVLRTSACSVEIVRSHSPASPSSEDGMKLLLGTDGSECSTKAVYSIAHRPWPKGSKVRIVCVRELLGGENAAIASSPYSMYPESVVNEIVENARIRAEKAISEARAILSSANADLCDAWHTPLGDPRSILLDDAKTWGADLIVVGSHGRHGLDRLLLGSVSESVALHAHCSVEVIRS